MFGEHDLLDERIGQYLHAQSPVELYELILARYEVDYERDRPALIRDVMTYMWAAREGLSESELLDLLGKGRAPLPNALWSPLALDMGQSLIDHSGLYGFAHDALRRAVERRYLERPADRQQAHRRLAAYFDGRDLSPRKVRELPWQLQQAGELNRLAACLRDLALLHAAVKNNALEVCRYWDAIEKNTSRRRDRVYRAVVETPEKHLDAVRDVAMLLMNGGYHDVATRMLAAAQTHCSATGQRELQAEFLGSEFRVERNRRLHDREFKIARVPREALLKRTVPERRYLLDAGEGQRQRRRGLRPWPSSAAAGRQSLRGRGSDAGHR